LCLSGQQVLQGIQLATNESGLVHNGTLEVVIRDSSSRPVNQVVEELATDPGMIGIVGPVLSQFVKQVIPIADQYSLPVFTPTASAIGLAELSPFVFRNAMTRELEGKYIAEYAVNILRLHRFTILYPLERFGFELRDSFVREVESLGGEVVAVIPYDRSQTDFKKQILEIGGISDDKLKKLVKDQLKDNTESAPLGQGGPVSRPLIEMGIWSGNEIQNLKVSLELSYDAVFLPGFYDKVGLIVPQLVFYNIDTATLLVLVGGTLRNWLN
jgi:outer membrane PBP1 activator LpoA protein